MCFRGSTIRGKMNRADRYVLSALSRTAGARRYVLERREKRTSGKHRAVKQLWQSCGPGCADGNNDTCVGYTSQSRTPRHKHGGRHGKSYGAAGPPPSALPLRNIVIRNDPHIVKCGFCHIKTDNTFHGETHFHGRTVFHRDFQVSLLAKRNEK